MKKILMDSTPEDTAPVIFKEFENFKEISPTTAEGFLQWIKILSATSEANGGAPIKLLTYQEKQIKQPFKGKGRIFRKPPTRVVVQVIDVNTGEIVSEEGL